VEIYVKVPPQLKEKYSGSENLTMEVLFVAVPYADEQKKEHSRFSLM
jgi:hypothetical protein